MFKVTILSASVRRGRNSHRVTLYFKNFMEEQKFAEVNLIDLAELDFPVFHERLQYTESPSQKVLDFANTIKSANGVLIVTPEYNGGYPASLKNVIDLLYTEWRRKPIAIATVSAGPFGGSQVITSLQFSLWKIQAWTVPAMFPVAKVAEAFSEDGIPTDKTATDKRAKRFLEELMWCMEAKSKMDV